MCRRAIACAFAVCCLLQATFHVAANEPEPNPSVSAASSVSFEKEIQPLFSRHCYGCHQGAKQQGDYDMTNFATLTAGGETGEAAIVAGKPDESYLVEQITVHDGVAEMPRAPFPPLSSVEVDLVRRWIAEGAVDDSPEDSGPRYDSDHPPEYVAAPSLPSMDISPDGAWVAVAGFHEVVLKNAKTGVTQHRLVGMSPRINTVRFSPDGKRLLAVGGTPGVRGELQVWQVDAGELALSLPVTYDALCGASWAPDGSKIAFGASDNVVRAVDSETGEQVLFQGAHEDWVRDTAFTHDGTHLISVARDMSCKLTEVATERFVDNITSITPGALSGGLNSVAAHPQRNEIVVGGADGIAKVYRVFRETQRRIGDDANLVRVLPKMPGRIFAVAISDDGKRIAAASTLDGVSEIRAWEYDFDGTLTKPLKTILAKRVADRSAEEKKQVEDYRNQPVKELFRENVSDAAVYAIAFSPEGAVWFTSADGKVRGLDAAGAVQSEYVAFDAKKEASARGQFDAAAWMSRVDESTSADDSQIESSDNRSTEAIVFLRVQPESIHLDSPYAYAQLVITGVKQDQSTTDLTRQCKMEIPDWARVSKGGLLRPTDNGKGILRIRHGDLSASIEMSAEGVRPDSETTSAEMIGAVDYVRDVAPVMSRLGCNQGTCHGAQKGKNGFRLSLRGYDPVFDRRALTDDLAARRINAASPEESLMLRKPLGTTPHQGGVLMTEEDPYHAILRRWIADGSRVDLDSARVERIEVFPSNPIVQSTVARQQVRVVAHYVDGSQRDVTHEAFIESGNTEVATAARGGLLSAVRRGEAPILARFEGAYAATTLTVMGDRSGYQPTTVEAWSPIDSLVAAKWERVKVVPSDLCDDATFLRRVHLDLTGLPPSSDEVRAFLADETPTRIKRRRIVDSLIGSDPYVDYWTNKWADLLQVNRKFLGVEGSQEFRAWIRKSISENKPYDQFAREILTATGSNKDNPPASYFKVLRTPEDTMENTTHLFMGIRFNCNKCHDHPFERWTQDQYYEMSSFFARVGLDQDPASKGKKIGGTAVEGAKPLYEIIKDKKEGEVMHPKTNLAVEPAFPFDVTHKTDPAFTRRERLAQWMTDSDNPYFARSYVNRLWGYLMGVGLIEPIDDIRAGNPPTNPELLDHLTNEFVQSGFDVQQALRSICNSHTYQLSVQTNSLNEDDRLNYSHALPRRLPAEVIYDSVHTLTGAVSKIPGVTAGTRAAALSDSGVKLEDGFLQNLGRPARESACECERSSDLQLGPVMALISGPTIGTAIADPKNELEQIVDLYPEDEDLVEEIFLRALSRQPVDAERDAFTMTLDLIREDHQRLIKDLASAEEKWKLVRLELEAKRESDLKKTIAKIESRTREIEPERKRLEANRQEGIKKAEEVLAAAKAELPAKEKQWRKKHSESAEWFPLFPSKAVASNKAKLIPQPDRSIVAEGNANKGIYTITLDTGLKRITGFRIEALDNPGASPSGPGLAANGNFVITEIKIKAADRSNPKKTTPVAIASGLADFTQSGFNVAKTFDGRDRDQGGWAVAGASHVGHWVTLKLEEPIANDPGSVITFELYQFHNAQDHRLRRFRISATTDEGDIPLGTNESLAAVLRTPEAQLDENAKKRLREYVAATDKSVRDATSALATAKKPVPPDAGLVSLEARKKRLSEPTPDDPALVQLREDVRQSEMQTKNIRLTAAEDLTWALINSPAFLFNH